MNLKKDATHHMPRWRMAAAALAAGAALTAPALAQQQAPAAPQGGQAPQGWYKTCQQQAEADICVVQNVITASNGQLVTAVGMITIEGQQNQRLMQVSVPTARLIEPGIQMSIDGGEAQRLDYTVCMPDRCVAEAPLSDTLVNSFKRGGEVVFSSVNYQRSQNPIPISLQGFTDAFDGEGLRPSELEERQRLLQEEAERDAAERRSRLEEAQEQAKEQ